MPEQATHSGDEEFPAIVKRAQDDVRCRQALASLGYSQVRSAYARHRQVGLDVFEDLGHERLWPTVDFVRDWLKEERRRIVAQVQWPFVGAMLATIFAGLVLFAVHSVLG
jgi:hypothetical protein